MPRCRGEKAEAMPCVRLIALQMAEMMKALGGMQVRACCTPAKTILFPSIGTPSPWDSTRRIPPHIGKERGCVRALVCAHCVASVTSLTDWPHACHLCTGTSLGFGTFHCSGELNSRCRHEAAERPPAIPIGRIDRASALFGACFMGGSGGTKKRRSPSLRRAAGCAWSNVQRGSRRDSVRFAIDCSIVCSV